MRKKREQFFPQSKDDFYSKPADVRIRASRFLIADYSKQEKMMNEFGWAHRQVKPLQDIFKQDVRFFFELYFQMSTKIYRKSSMQKFVALSFLQPRKLETRENHKIRDLAILRLLHSWYN